MPQRLMATVFPFDVLRRNKTGRNMNRIELGWRRLRLQRTIDIIDTRHQMRMRFTNVTIDMMELYNYRGGGEGRRREIKWAARKTYIETRPK